MDKRIIDAIPEIVSHLRKHQKEVLNAFLGFDACIDKITLVVKSKKENGEQEYFTNLRHFGEFLISRENKSCGVELQTKLSKIGGNMVIMANALGSLGFKVDCIGTFGLPGILPVFNSMSPNCTLYTIADTIQVTAMEFNDSKVMMYDPGPYFTLDWKDIKSILGIEKIKELLTGKQLVSFVNWSEIENATRIWQGILEEILPSVVMPEKAPYFFTDLADFARKPEKEIQILVELLGRFKQYFRVIISLNENEADLVAKAMGVPRHPSDESFIRTLYNSINVDVLIIHRTKDALAFDGNVYEKCDTFFCENPEILTGAGDNFNAGYCYSLFHGFNLFHSLLVANSASGYYVKTGISPDPENLLGFLELNMKDF
jgi:hypothetical protein